MKLIKDLLYTKGNLALDIARFSALFSVLSFWGCIFYRLYLTGQFSPTETGVGITTIMGGAAGWIYARQKYEANKDVPS